AIASLALISVGLAIIFGMMRVINLAHGEFLMLGGYAAIVATNQGISIWIAMLVVAPIVVGIIGVVVERTIIRFLYGRMIDTMLNANMAAALGVNPSRVYAITFGVGAALSGLAGAVLAPVSGVFPTIGVAYVAKSFITVISGGAAIVSGTVSASALFGTINQI